MKNRLPKVIKFCAMVVFFGLCVVLPKPLANLFQEDVGVAYYIASVLISCFATFPMFASGYIMHRLNEIEEKVSKKN